MALPDAHVVRSIWRSIQSGESPIWITGAAGTGKSLVLRLIARELGNAAVLAPTGVAALAIEGQTLHSFFRLNRGVQVPGDDGIRRPRDIYRNLSAVLIDEASMVRADVFDKIDEILREARESPAAFGGLPVVLVGDLCQLPPVVTKPDRPVLQSLGYDGPFFFNALVHRRNPVRVFVLDQIHRQRDPRFVEVLNAVRLGRICPTLLRRLNRRVIDESVVDGLGSLVLTPLRLEADFRNAQSLNALHTPETVYRGVVQGRYPRRELPAPLELRLRPGAQVMLVKNDGDGRWVNGTMATVISCARDHVVVDRADGRRPCTVYRTQWEKHTLRYDVETGSLRRQLTGRYVQFPVRLGWAATIHKAQSLTLDRVHVDLASGAFAPGQTYVACSRSRTAGGLTLARPVRPSDLVVDSRVLEFLREQGLPLAA